ncbi:MAG: 3'(2'),5'-bisphosphate nucleotidase CysQ [Alphaproteobacteria bacterium]|nr:3'(2'),5'-bisphosphate nucleotidase CysQ [Alphaproteobacteria bacterium]
MPSPANLQSLATPLLAIAREAGRAILTHYHPEVTRSDKSDGSPVTAADHASEAIIVRALAKLDPGIPVVAEEEFAAGRVHDVGDGRFWLVDPLDGTKEFLKANGEFTVNIGLVENRRPILGVILAPVGDEIFWGAEGRAFAQKGSGPARPIAARKAPPEGLVVLASRSHSNRDDLKQFLADKKVSEIRIGGSAIKFCRVAAGEGDLYPRLGPTMEWDTAAGQAILDAAGGSTTTLDGRPFLYAKPGFLNGKFIARGK